MATMTVANPQALRALEHANHVRSARAQLKRAIAAGTLSAAGAPTRGRAGSRARSRKAGGCSGYRLGRGVLLAGHPGLEPGIAGFGDQISYPPRMPSLQGFLPAPLPECDRIEIAGDLVFGVSGGSQRASARVTASARVSEQTLLLGVSEHALLLGVRARTALGRPLYGIPSGNCPRASSGRRSGSEGGHLVPSAVLRACARSVANRA